MLSCLSLAGGASFAVEFEVLDKFSVDGYTEFRGSVSAAGGLFTVGMSTLVVKGGYVGIGTALPGYGLDVVHTDGIHLSTTAVPGYGLYLNSAGNLGIGTASPTRLLTVNGTGANQGFQILSALGTRLNYIGGLGSVAAAAEQGYFELRDNAAVEVVFNTGGSSYINTGGNVGIGTTSPGSRLEVAGGSSTFRGTDSNSVIAGFTDEAGNDKVVISTSGNLDVTGGIKIGTVTANCSPAIAGTLRWYDGHMSVCNGANWRQLDNQPPPTIASITPASGLYSLQTAITINGTGFTPGPELIIGGVTAANIVVVSPTQITATAPAGAVGTRDLKITNPDGQYVTGSFTYNPLPTIAGVSPASGSGLGGTPITITGTGFLAGAGITVADVSATVIVRVSDTQITATTPANSAGGVKNVKVINSDTGSAELTGINGFTYNVYATATGGGSNENNGSYRIHTFTSDGSITFATGGNIEVLVVAGGGAGSIDHGGGGGGGGVLYSAAYPVSANTPLAVTIGAGGQAVTGSHVSISSPYPLNTQGGATSRPYGAARSGGNSVFGSVTALGGGGGSGFTGPPGAAGGSGGGAGAQSNTSGGAATQGSPSGMTGFGSAGGGDSLGSDCGGGGGGAGGAGVNGTGTASPAANGGIGVAYNISGISAYYGGGGGGGQHSSSRYGDGGLGGGGYGIGVNGTANTGGGRTNDGAKAGDGGSGIVIIKYLK